LQRRALVASERKEATMEAVRWAIAEYVRQAVPTSTREESR
jgi:hypothetical protein